MPFDNGPVDFDPWARNRVVEKRAKREDFCERMGDAYIGRLAAGIVFGYAAGLALAFFENLRGGPGSGVVRANVGVVPGQSAASALVMLGMLGALLLISKLGPTAVDRAQGFWWLSLPVARSGFLARLLRQRLVGTFLCGAFLWLPIGYGTVLGGLARGSFAGVPAGAATLGLLFVGLSLLAAWSQARQAAGRFRTALNAAAIGGAAVVAAVPGPGRGLVGSGGSGGALRRRICRSGGAAARYSQQGIDFQRGSERTRRSGAGAA